MTELNQCHSKGGGTEYTLTSTVAEQLKALLGALGDIADGEPEWPDDPQRELDWCRNRAAKVLTAYRKAKDGG